MGNPPRCWGIFRLTANILWFPNNGRYLYLRTHSIMSIKRFTRQREVTANGPFEFARGSTTKKPRLRPMLRRASGRQWALPCPSVAKRERGCSKMGGKCHPRIGAYKCLQGAQALHRKGPAAIFESSHRFLCACRSQAIYLMWLQQERASVATIYSRTLA